MAFIDPKLVPKRKLYDGREIPCLGLGTFGSDHFSPEQVAGAVAVGVLNNDSHALIETGTEVTAGGQVDIDYSVFINDAHAM